MKKTLLSVAVSALLAAPAMAQVPTLDQVSKELQELKTRNERLEAEVEYLKEQAKAARKDSANEAVEVSNLKSTSAKMTWGGDFRYRHERIATEGNVTDRGRDRIRLRFGPTIKVNDDVTVKIQIATTNTGGDNARSTNQTMGNGAAGNGTWDRKALNIDLAYADWKPASGVDVLLGKMPTPWARPASYMWDPDLTPEGAAIKFAHGTWFASASYLRLAEQDSGNNTTFGVARSTDSNVAVAQVGLKQPIGATTLTAAASYRQISHVQDQPVTVAGTGCGVYSAANPTFGGSSYGNTTYTVGTAPNTCALLLSGFSEIELFAQLDFNLGAFPVSTFVDYMQNNDAIANPVVNAKLDSAMSVGVMFNKASAPKSWEAGVVYQKAEKDAVFGQFHDSDFGGGVTDTEGLALKGAWVAAPNWTLNATYFINQRYNDVPATNGTIAVAKTDHDYKRLQLDLNFKF